MASKYLLSLSMNDYSSRAKMLRDIQRYRCFLCEEKIELGLHKETKGTHDAF